MPLVEDFEYRVQNYLRKKGHYVIRAYGSKGMYDLIAVPPSNDKQIQNYPLMIQCKTNGYIKPKERESLHTNRYKWQGWQIIAMKTPKIKKNGELSKQTDILFKSLEGGKLII